MSIETSTSAVTDPSDMRDLSTDRPKPDPRLNPRLSREGTDPEAPSIGRIVHCRAYNGPARCMPMMITYVWSPESVNGTVFPDGTNDYPGDIPIPQVGLVRWVTSVTHNVDLTAQGSSWHWHYECGEQGVGVR